MDYSEVIKYVDEQNLILVPVLYILGIMLKNTKIIKDWTIPWILLLVGVAGAICLSGADPTSIIQGVLVTGLTVYANQLFKQSTNQTKKL